MHFFLFFVDFSVKSCSNKFVKCVKTYPKRWIHNVNYATFGVKMGKKRNRLILKKGKKMTNTNESGRSMVEMLGVLAIIGVLSVMGIAGYTQAMKKYRANEAAAEITMGAMLCASTGNVTGMTFKYLSATTQCDPTDKDEFTWGGYESGVDGNMVAEMFSARGYTLSGNSFKLVS